MNTAPNSLEQFGAILRDIVRDAIRTELKSASHLTPTPPADKIGGIKLFTEVTGMAAQTGYNLASRREVPHSKRGGKLIFSEAELREWLVENRRTMAENAGKDAFKFVVAPTTRKKGGTKR